MTTKIKSDGNGSNTNVDTYSFFLTSKFSDRNWIRIDDDVLNSDILHIQISEIQL
jgi:hypothetical protein